MKKVVKRLCDKMSVLATMSSLSASKLDDTRIHPKRSAIKQISQRFAEVISNGVCSACNGYYGEFFYKPAPFFSNFYSKTLK